MVLLLMFFCSFDCLTVVYDSSSEARLLPSSATVITASVHADDPYFRNGLVRANVTWQIADYQKGS